MSSLYERIESELELVSSSDKNNYYYKFIEEVNKIIDKYPEDSVKVGLDLILKSQSHKPWSPINLSDENFGKLGNHFRAWYIQKDNIGIYNALAYTGKIRKYYITEKDNKTVEAPVGIILREKEIIDERIYISRGGIINGDYIHKCYLKYQTGYYSIKDSIKIPVFIIELENSVSITELEDNVNFILFVDHREPKLKALMDFYDVNVEHDDNIKFNIRTFKKLK